MCVSVIKTSLLKKLSPRDTVLFLPLSDSGDELLCSLKNDFLASGKRVSLLDCTLPDIRFTAQEHKETEDFIFLSAPPLSVSRVGLDALDIADSVVIIITKEKSTHSDLQNALKLLGFAEAHMVGTILM